MHEILVRSSFKNFLFKLEVKFMSIFPFYNKPTIETLNKVRSMFKLNYKDSIMTPLTSF